MCGSRLEFLYWGVRVALRTGRTIDFTKGNIVWNLIIFSIPIVLGELLQNLYTAVDSIVVGNFVGDKALAAVSACAAISQMIIGFFNGMSIGSSVIASRYFGGNHKERLESAMRNSFAFAVILGFALSCSAVGAAGWLLRFIAVPEEVYTDAVIYLRIYLAGVMFTVIYNIGAGLLLSVGDSHSTFKILSLVCSLNIVLDVLFVRYLRMGVAGVGVATVFSQFTSVILVYRRLKTHSSSFRLTFNELINERAMIGDMIAIGMPAGMQNSLISFSNLFVWRYISSFNSAVMAGFGAAMRVDRFVALPCKAFGLALTTFVGQNVGAKQPKRVRQGFMDCLYLSGAYCAALGAVLYFLAPNSIMIFSRVPAVVENGVNMMHYLLPFYVFMALRETSLGILRGYGDAKVPMYLSLFGMVVLRQIYLAIALSIEHDPIHICIGYPLAWVVTALSVYIYWLYRRRFHESKLEMSRTK